MKEEKDKNNETGNGNDGGTTHDTVTIHFGHERKVSPNPTTGRALYALGSVDCNTMDLFRELHGQGDDDELIPCDDTIIQLKNGDHFYSAQKILNPGYGR